MLTYKINQSELNKLHLPLKINGFSKNYLNEIEQYDTVNNDKMLLHCNYDGDFNLKNGDKIVMFSKLVLNYKNENNHQYKDNFEFTNLFEIYNLDRRKRDFNIFIDKFYDLDVTSIKSYFDERNKNIQEIYFHFGNNHFFDDNDYILENNSKKEIIIYFTNFETYQTHDIGVLKKLTFNVMFLTPYDLKITFDDWKEVDKDLSLYKTIFGTTQLKTMNGNIANIVIKRMNFIVNDDVYVDFFIENNFGKLPVALQSTFENTLFQNELIENNFIKQKSEEVINRVVDMEKDIYYPCIVKKDEQQGLIIDNFVKEIKFNLHFREHRGENWVVENNALWNGVKNGKVNTRYTNDSVSDLLCFLDFNNSDIFNQKNKLKKSFLRLSFYDTNNPLNQNLIGYSTIFFNTGKLFKTYTDEISTPNYYSVVYPKDKYGVYEYFTNKVGLKVDREYFNYDIFEKTNIFDENKRLSSQFLVNDRIISNNSSEGFYLYIWKDNHSIEAQDIYMKVEFNHAGYGRTIPFMYPFWDYTKHDKIKIRKNHVKTFQEIVNDFTLKSTNSSDEFYDGPYGMRQYTKYSYIHLKYVYDIVRKKHVYYLDPETYGINSQSGNTITINLYEAKLGEQIDENS